MDSNSFDKAKFWVNELRTHEVVSIVTILCTCQNGALSCSVSRGVE